MLARYERYPRQPNPEGVIITRVGCAILECMHTGERAPYPLPSTYWSQRDALIACDLIRPVLLDSDALTARGRQFCRDKLGSQHWPMAGAS